MEDNDLKNVQDKLDQLLASQKVTQKKEDKLSKNLTFLFSAALPVVIAVIGIYFTNENNRRQIEFQQIQIADAMVNEVKGDSNFNKDKLDLKLNFVQQMFDDVSFRNKIDTILTQTYLAGLRGEDLALQIQSANPEQRTRAYQKIQDAKQFNDPKVNKLLKQIDSTPGVQTSVQAEQAKQQVSKNVITGTQSENGALQTLRQLSAKHPNDTALQRLINKAEQNAAGAQNPAAPDTTVSHQIKRNANKQLQGLKGKKPPGQTQQGTPH